MRIFFAAMAALSLTACTQSDAEMRFKPPSRQFTSDKSADELVACLVPSISAHYRGAYGRQSLFNASVRAPGQEYDITTPDALVDGKYIYTVNVRGSVVSIYELLGIGIAGYMRDGLVRGIEPCL